MNSLKLDHAFVDELAHLGQALVGKIGADQMEAVVDRGLAFGLLVPDVDRLDQRLAVILHGEVDDRRRSAVRRGDRAGVEVIGRGRAAERQFHVRVRVDAAGDDQLALGVDDVDRLPSMSFAPMTAILPSSMRTSA